MQFTALSFVFWVLLIRKRLAPQERVLWVAALAGSLLGLLVLALQPGAHLRLAQMPPMPGLGRLVYLTLRHSAALVYHSLVDFLPARLAALLLGFLFGLSARGQKIPPLKELLTPLGLTALGAFLLITAFCAPSALAQSAYPEARSANYRCLSHQRGAARGGLFGWRRLRLPPARKKLTGLAHHTKRRRAGSMFFALNQLPAQFSEYRRHAAAWDEREAIILRKKDEGARSVLVPGVDSLAGLAGALARPRPVVVNGCAASYYQLDSIRSTE